MFLDKTTNSWTRGNRHPAPLRLSYLWSYMYLGHQLRWHARAQAMSKMAYSAWLRQPCLHAHRWRRDPTTTHFGQSGAYLGATRLAWTTNDGYSIRCAQEIHSWRSFLSATRSGRHSHCYRSGRPRVLRHTCTAAALMRCSSSHVYQQRCQNSFSLGSTSRSRLRTRCCTMTSLKEPASLLSNHRLGLRFRTQQQEQLEDYLAAEGLPSEQHLGHCRLTGLPPYTH